MKSQPNSMSLLAHSLHHGMVAVIVRLRALFAAPYFLAALLAFYVLCGTGSAGAANWAAGLASLSGATTAISASASDAAGNVYLLGNHAASYFPLGSTDLAVIGTQDAFVAKFDSSGNVVWAKPVGGAGATVTAQKIAVDAFGNVYVIGQFNGGNLTTPALTKLGTTDSFAIKYDSSGNTVWAKNFGGSGATLYGTAIAVDAVGNVYLAGYFSGTPTNPALTSIGTLDAYAIKLNASGTIVWKKNFGGNTATYGGAYVTPKGIAVDAAGNVVLAGYYVGTTPSQGTSLTTPVLNKIGGQDGFAIKLDASGTITWAKNFGGSAVTTFIKGVVLDANGNIYLTGQFSGANLTAPALTKIGSTDGLVMKLDADGNNLWQTNYGGLNVAVNGNAITLDSAGNVLVGGLYLNGSMTTPVLAGIGVSSTYAAKLDPSAGSITWIKGFGGAGVTFYETGIAADANGNAFLSGYFSGGNLTTPTLTKLGSQDGFLFKLDGNGSTTWAKNVTGFSASTTATVTATAMDAAGNTYVAGYFSSSVLRIGTTALSKIGTQDGFVAKFDGSGTPLWAVSQGGSAASVTLNAIAVDSSGLVYVGGHFSNQSLSSPAVTKIGTTDLFAFKLDASGATLWAKNFGGSGANLIGFGIAVDGTGNVYLSGTLSSGNSVSPAMTKVGTTDAIALKLDSSGTLSWGKNYGGTSVNAYARGIAVDSAGDVYLGGYFSGNNLTTLSLTKRGTTDAFLAKLSSTGSTTWAKNYGGTSANVYGRGVAVDGSGNVYLGGFFSSANLTVPPLTKLGSFDAFVFKVATSTGNSVWSKGFGGSGSGLYGYGIAADTSGYVYLGGNFSASNATNPSMSRIGTTDVFAIKLNSTGGVDWSANYGGSSATLSGNAIAADGNGNFAVAGGFSGSSLTSPAVTRRGTNDGLVIRALALSAPGAPTGVTVQNGDGVATVSFTAPTSTGGTAITGYTATCTSSDGGTTGSANGTASPLTVSGLSNGKTYTCTVSAANSVGSGSASSASAGFSPLPPPTPSTPLASASVNLATLTFQSDKDGTGYFTLVASGGNCGSGAQIKAGKDGSDAAALRFGSLTLSANTATSYTIRNLAGNTAYRLCFSADNQGVLQTTPTSATFTTGSGASLAGSWNAVGSAGFSLAGTAYPSLAFTTDGTPLVAYMDNGSAGKATLMQYSGGAWSALGGAGFSAAAIGTPSLAISPDGTPYLAYVDNASSYKGFIMKYANGAWSAVGAAAYSTGTASYSSLAFAPDGTPYVAFYDGARSGKGTVVKYSGGSWVTVGSTGFTVGSVGSPTLVFGADGLPYLGYYDGSSGKANVMKFDGTTWSSVGSADFSSNYAYDHRLSVAPDGSLYVVFRDGANSYKATVMKYSGGAWGVVGSAGFSVGMAYSPSLAFAPDGTPYVAYSDYADNYKLAVMKFSGGAWIDAGSSLSAGNAGTPALGVSPTGQLYVAFTDTANGGKATMLTLQASVPGVPGAPTAVSATAGNGQATLSWTAPTSNGGAAIEGYRVQVATSASGTYAAAAGGCLPATTLASTTTSCTATGLTNGTDYFFQVAAKNSVGTGSYSTASSAVTPLATVPDAPTGVSVTAGDGQVSVSWTAPSNDGGSAIAGYQVQVATSANGTYSDAAGGCLPATTLASTTVSCMATGLSNGTQYFFKVAAKNGAGTGSYSSASSGATPSASVTAPDAPTGVTATAGNGQATISWTAPANNGGAAIAGYQVQVATSANGTYTDAAGGCLPATTLAVTTTSCTATGLTNGTQYFFKVAAKNGAGTGSYSSASSAVTPVAPPAPQPQPSVQPTSNTSLPSGGGNAQPLAGQTVVVSDNGSKGSTIVLPPPPDKGQGANRNTVSVTLPGSGTIAVNGNREGSKLSVTQVILPGSKAPVAAVTVDQGSATLTASKSGQPVAALKNGIVVVSGSDKSEVSVDSTGANAKIGVKNNDTIVVPSGAQNVSGTRVDLPPPGDKGEHKPVAVSVGGKEISVEAKQANTTMIFKVVDIGGVQTPVIEVSGTAQVSSSGDNQPLVSVGGNVVRSGSSGAQKCNTVVHTSNANNVNAVRVVSCYIVLDVGSFSALGGGNGFAAVKDGIVWAGETAELDQDGKVIAAYLGSREGNSDAIGDDLSPGPNKFAGSYTSNVFIPRLAGTAQRLNGAALDASLFNVLNAALGTTTSPALPSQDGQGILSFTVSGGTDEKARNTLNFALNGNPVSVIPTRRVRGDTSRADGVSVSSEGDVEVASGGLIATFAPSVADPQAFAAALGKALPGAAIQQRWNGTWQVIGNDGTAYVARPAWSRRTQNGAGGFTAQSDGTLVYLDGSHAQLIVADFHDYTTLLNTLAKESGDANPRLAPNMDGTVKATLGGKTYTLAPQWRLLDATSVTGKPAWWVDNGMVYVKNADGTAQGFTVK